MHGYRADRERAERKTRRDRVRGTCKKIKILGAEQGQASRRRRRRTNGGQQAWWMRLPATKAAVLRSQKGSRPGGGGSENKGIGDMTDVRNKLEGGGMKEVRGLGLRQGQGHTRKPPEVKDPLK